MTNGPYPANKKYFSYICKSHILVLHKMFSQKYLYIYLIFSKVSNYCLTYNHNFFEHHINVLKAFCQIFLQTIKKILRRLLYIIISSTCISVFPYLHHIFLHFFCNLGRCKKCSDIQKVTMTELILKT